MSIQNLNYEDMDGKGAAKVIAVNFNVAIEKAVNDLNKQLKNLTDKNDAGAKLLKFAEKFSAFFAAAMHHLKNEAAILKPIYGNEKKYLSEEDYLALQAEHKALITLLDELNTDAAVFSEIKNQAVTQKLFMAKLFNLEQDMRKNMYLENNMLLPKMRSPMAYNYSK